MSRIPTLATEQAPAASQVLLAQVEQQIGSVSNLHRIVANSPAALEAFLAFLYALDKGELDELDRERIALAVAEVNSCDYCLSAQVHRVRKGGMLDDTEITANRSGASNNMKAEAAVRFASKLVRQRGHVSEPDVQAVKEAGYSNAAIVEIVAHVAANVFANTVNEAFKTDIDFPLVPARRLA